MFGSLRKPLNRAIGIYIFLALVYWAFDVFALDTGIELRLPWAVASEKSLLGMGQWIPNLRNHLPGFVELFGVEGGLQYARILTATCMLVVVALLSYAVTWRWRPDEKLEWVPMRSIGHLERHRAISAIAAVGMAYLLLIGVQPRHGSLSSIFAATGDPIRMLLSPIAMGLILTFFAAYGVEQTVYIRRYEKLHSDPESGPKF